MKCLKLFWFPSHVRSRRQEMNVSALNFSFIQYGMQNERLGVTFIFLNNENFLGFIRVFS
jgi:hypothetical protein